MPSPAASDPKSFIVVVNRNACVVTPSDKSADPTTKPEALIPFAVLLFPPRVPREVIEPLVQVTALDWMSPDSVEKPAITPLLLTAVAPLKLPPSVPKCATLYC